MPDASDLALTEPIAAVPAGAWAVGVSGGADSVALLELLRQRSDLSLHVAHLDHETRAGASAADAAFVRDFSAARGLAHTIARRSEIEPSITAALPGNKSSRFRAIRLELFHRVVEKHKLQGVVLAHHADDQAETVMQRLLRGGCAPGGFGGMSPLAHVRGVKIVRPLLSVRREALRVFLRRREIAWREDASNASMDQQRNRVRALLAKHANVHDTLIDLSVGCASLVQWLGDVAPALGDSFIVDEIAHLPAPVAREALRRWLALRGANEVIPAGIERLLQMTLDRATAPRQHFSGGVLVGRRGGKIFVVDDADEC
jgi:tRNA(Ile)-lysidine synthase